MTDDDGHRPSLKALAILALIFLVLLVPVIWAMGYI